jgi:hypothetical protein
MKLTVVIALITSTFADPLFSPRGIDVSAISPKFTIVQNIQGSNYRGAVPPPWFFPPQPPVSHVYPEYSE